MFALEERLPRTNLRSQAITRQALDFMSPLRPLVTLGVDA